MQVLIKPTPQFETWSSTLLYPGGIRFDETWSTLMMFGGRMDLEGPNNVDCFGLQSGIGLGAADDGYEISGMIRLIYAP